MTKKTNLFERWRLLALISATLTTMAAIVVIADAGSTESIRLVIRLTARTSLALFLMAFLATALLRLFPSPITRWQRRNRRYLGLGFAASHGIHALALIALVTLDPKTFWSLTTAVSIVTGGAAYVVIMAMSTTSFDRMLTLLGPKAWKALHWTGSWFIWASFVFTFGKRIPTGLWYAFPVALLVVALALRIVTRLRMRRSAPVGAAPAAG